MKNNHRIGRTPFLIMIAFVSLNVYSQHSVHIPFQVEQTVLALPAAGNNGPVCSGFDLQLFALSVDTGVSYSWTGPNGFSSSEQNPLVSSNVDPSMAGIYVLHTILNGCVSPDDTTEVIVKAIPLAPVAGNNGPVCIGLDLSLTASTIEGADYSWTGPEGFASTIQNPIVSNSATTSMSGTYYVTATVGGCASSTSSTDVTVNMVVNPFICMVSVDSSRAKNIVIWNKPLTKTIDHFNVYVEGNQANLYLLLGSVPYDSQGEYIDDSSIPAQRAYCYKISAYDTCGAETELSDFHKSIHLTISQGMGTTYNLIWTDYVGIDYQTVNLYRGTKPSDLTLLTTVSSSINSYTDLNPPAGYVYYQIGIENPNPCSPARDFTYSSTRSNIATNNPNGIGDEETSMFIQVYPNPAKDEIIIVYPNYLPAKNPTLEVSCIDGQMIKKISVKGVKTQLDISELPTGVFIIKLITSDGVAVTRCVKE